MGLVTFGIIWYISHCFDGRAPVVTLLDRAQLAHVFILALVSQTALPAVARRLGLPCLERVWARRDHIRDHDRSCGSKCGRSGLEEEGVPYASSAVLLERDLCVAGRLRDAVVFAIDAVVVVTGSLMTDAIVGSLLLVTRDRCVSANDKGLSPLGDEFEGHLAVGHMGGADAKARPTAVGEMLRSPYTWTTIYLIYAATVLQLPAR